MSDLSTVKVGDSVVLLDINYKGHRIARVDRIGRKYITASNGEQFDKVTGRVHDDYGNSRILTHAGHEMEASADAAMVGLRNLGVELHSCSPEKTLAIADALAPLMVKWAEGKR